MTSVASSSEVDDNAVQLLVRGADDGDQGPSEIEKSAALAGLEAEFYDENFDACAYLLSSMPSTRSRRKKIEKSKENDDDNDDEEEEEEEEEEDDDDSWIAKQTVQKGIALEIIKSQLSTRIMESYDSFVQGMVEIGELGDDLQTAARLCKSGRENLFLAKRSLVQNKLALLATHRKRILHEQVLRQVLAIKELRETEQTMQVAVDAGEFPRAIAMCLKAQQALPHFKQFVATRGLNASIDDSLDMIQNRLDEALADICRAFDAHRYERALTGYRLLGKSYRVIDRMQRYFTHTIHSNSQNIVYAHILQSDARPEQLKRAEYKELCAKLKDEHFLPCLQHILECNCDVMLSHWRLQQWHGEFDSNQANAKENDDRKDKGEEEEEEEEEDKNEENNEKDDDQQIYTSFDDVKTRLSDVAKNMWDEMQRKVSILLSSSQTLASFQIDRFLQVLDQVNRFIEIGEAFSNSNSRSLFATMKRQSKAYFANMHAALLDDLHTMLENDMWITMPLSADYSIRHIKEFQAFLNISPKRLMRMRETRGLKRDPDAIFAEFERTGNPFSAAAQAVRDDDEMRRQQGDAGGGGGGASSSSTASIDGIDEALLQESIDEGDDGVGDQGDADDTDAAAAKKPAKRDDDDDESGEGPMLTSTAITILKNLGKYLHMMQLLQPISVQVFHGFAQIFEYYMFAIYSFFGGLPKQASDRELSFPTLTDQLRVSLRRIRSRLLVSADRAKDSAVDGDGGADDDVGALGGASSSSSASSSSLLSKDDGKLSAQQRADRAAGIIHRVPAARLSASVDIKSKTTVYGIEKRATAIESLMFIMHAVKAVQPHLKRLLPKPHMKAIAIFYGYSVDVCAELRRYLYEILQRMLIYLDHVPAKITEVRWDIEDFAAVAEPEYVNIVGTEFTMFSARIDDAIRRKLIPSRIGLVLWQLAIQFCMQQLVEGFSRAKQCSDGGRALMSLGVTQVQHALRPLIGDETLALLDASKHPFAELLGHATSYVKAYYLPQIEILPWVQQHATTYTSRQLVALVNHATSKSSRKTRQELIKQVEHCIQQAKGKK
jgi:syndetin